MGSTNCAKKNMRFAGLSYQFSLKMTLVMVMLQSLATAAHQLIAKLIAEAKFEAANNFSRFISWPWK